MQTAGIQKAEDRSQNGETGLAVVDHGSTSITKRTQQLSLAEIKDWAGIFIESGMFPDTQSVAQAMVKIKAGQELGFEPFVSMGGVHIIKCKASLGATLQASAICDSGRYRYQVIELSEDACELLFLELVGDRWQVSGKSRFTMDDAIAANLAGQNGQNAAMYKKYTRNMLFARAITNGMRWYTPDLLRAADGDAPTVDFDVDALISETADVSVADAVINEDADEGVRVPTEHVDGEIVEETKSPEQLRAEKVEHIQNLCKWLNEHKDSIAWTKVTLANYINEMFEVDDGDRSLDFESLDKLIADLTERLGALTNDEAKSV